MHDTASCSLEFGQSELRMRAVEASCEIEIKLNSSLCKDEKAH